MASHPSEDAPQSQESPRAKALPRALPLIGEAPALVPARMINESFYCERLMYLEWSQGEFADNAFTLDGQSVHARADTPGGTLPTPPTEDPVVTSDPKLVELVDEEAPPPYVARSIWLSSERLGMTAKIDVVEGDAAGNVIPIEYKRGAAPDVPEGAFLPERAQLCAQVLLLREHGYQCDHGEIYFAKSRRRVHIAIDQELEDQTLGAVQRIRELTLRGLLPPPLVDSPKCDGCSLVGICLPDETNLLRDDVDREQPTKPRARRVDPSRDETPEDASGSADSIAQFWPPTAEELEQASAEVVLRRLQPARDDKLPLYVQEQGAKISLTGEELIIKGKEGSQRARLPNTSHVSLFGNIQMTTQAVRACLERGIPISYLSSGGWFYGRAVGTASKNIELRVAQHRVLQDEAACLSLAKTVVASKIRNSRTLLRRNHASPSETTLSELEQLAKKVDRTATIQSLLGIEGTAARTYFGAFSGMLKGPSPGAFELERRNRRPPADPINALLSLVYSLLTTEITNAIAASGLDPLLGFYHQPRFGRPALALDLMEEFRPVLGDSTVINVINNGVVSASDFLMHPTGVALRPFARRRVMQAYERRLDQPVIHPVFGYRISYRRILEVQARLFGRFVMGEISSYPEFRVR